MATFILERYASAVNSSNLCVDERTYFSDSDILGAIALADRKLTKGDGMDKRKHPLAIGLQRLFCGDNKAATGIVNSLEDMAWRKGRGLNVKIAHVEALDMARACLAWYRDGVCKPCGGHGKTLIPGAPNLSDHDCQPCQGTGKVMFEVQFKPEHRELARWLIVEMDRESGMAGPEAMKALKPSLDL